MSETFNEKPALFQGEGAGNFQQRLPVNFLLDNSGSMQGKPIQELNEGLAGFREEILGDLIAAERVEAAVMTFGEQTKTVIPFSNVSNWELSAITAKGNLTRMVDGIETAIKYIDKRKNWLRERRINSYPAILMMLSDGAPNPRDQGVSRIAAQIHQRVEEGDLIFLAVGTTGADMAVMSELAHDTLPAQDISTISISQYFASFSKSMSSFAKSGTFGQNNLNTLNPS